MIRPLHCIIYSWLPFSFCYLLLFSALFLLLALDLCSVCYSWPLLSLCYFWPVSPLPYLHLATAVCVTFFWPLNSVLHITDLWTLADLCTLCITADLTYAVSIMLTPDLYSPCITYVWLLQSVLFTLDPCSLWITLPLHSLYYLLLTWPLFSLRYWVLASVLSALVTPNPFTPCTLCI